MGVSPIRSSASDRRRIDVSGQGQGSRGVCQSFEPASWHAPCFSQNSKFLRYRGAQFFVSGLRIEPVLCARIGARARSRPSVCCSRGLTRKARNALPFLLDSIRRSKAVKKTLSEPKPRHDFFGRSLSSTV